MNTKNTAEKALLRWCRSNPRGQGTPCMRNGHDGQCLIVDVNSTEPMPEPRYPDHRRTRRIAAAPTWAEVATTLGIEFEP